jgi:ribonuclease HI
MNGIKLFIDGSVNPQHKIGFGAYLILDESLYCSNFEEKIKTKKFENTSSTLLELQTLLWALEELSHNPQHIFVYTDCQNLIGLKKRCKAFENNGYLTKSNKLISNHELYKQFYQTINGLNCEFIKIKGHKKTSEKDSLDNLFSLVDKASRNALRNIF